MPSPSWENLDEFLDTDDKGGFAVKALFFSSGGGPTEVVGIFEDSTFNSQTGEFDMDIANPRFICKASCVAFMNRFDTVQVNGCLYQVSNPPLDDGTGMTIVRLAPYDPAS